MGLDSAYILFICRGICAKTNISAWAGSVQTLYCWCMRIIERHTGNIREMFSNKEAKEHWKVRGKCTKKDCIVSGKTVSSVRLEWGLVHYDYLHYLKPEDKLFQKNEPDRRVRERSLFGWSNWNEHWEKVPKCLLSVSTRSYEQG